MSSVRRGDFILPGKGKLILTKELLDQIEYLHDKVGGIEWCGILFYRHLEGDINTPESLVLQAEHLYPMDIGTEAYTEADIDIDAVIEMDEVIPDVRNLRKGLIHTHHNMRAFFSGTDMSELHESTPFHNFYLSLIVNFSGEYVARVAYLAKKTTTFEYKDASATEQTSVNEQEVLAMIDMDIHWETPEVVVPDYFRARHEVLKQKKAEKVQSYRPAYIPGATYILGSAPKVSETTRASYDWDNPSPSSKQGSLFVSEKDITKAGTLRVGDKELRPFSEVEKEVRGKIGEWLSGGITTFTQGVCSNKTIAAMLQHLKDWFDVPDNEENYPFFINQMQRSMEDVFDGYFPGLVSDIGTKLLDGYDENDVCTDLFAMFDSFEKYMVSMAEIRMDALPFDVDVPKSDFNDIYDKHLANGIGIDKSEKAAKKEVKETKKELKISKKAK